MPTKISPLAEVDSRAVIGEDVVIGPFCYVGPRVTLGDGARLDSHVTIVGCTTIGRRNRFFPGAVIGAEPQDVSYRESDTQLIIGDDNVFREGVTVNRGAEKEDRVTRIDNRNMLMANSHVAHNCHVYNNVILVNGVLLGGHVHVHDGAIVSGNSVVHHFSTIGTLAFISGGCRVPHDIPPYMLSAGSDNPTVKTVNVIGLRRNGIGEETINLIKEAHRLLYREHKSLETVRKTFDARLGGSCPEELAHLLQCIENQQRGKMGRAREAFRDALPPQKEDGTETTQTNESSGAQRRAA